MAAYFAAAAAFYRGDVDVGVFGALEDDRQRAGLDFYQRLVAAGVPRVLGHLFPVTLAVLGGRAAEITARFRRVTPSRSWDLNAQGEGFSAFLLECGQPPWLAELADLEWTLYLVGVAPRPATRAPGLCDALEVRAYRCAVHHAWSTARHHGHPCPVPAEQPTVLVIHRDVRSQHVRLFQPAREVLAVCGELLGEGPANLLPPARRAALHALQRQGVYSPPVES